MPPKRRSRRSATPSRKPEYQDDEGLEDLTQGMGSIGMSDSVPVATEIEPNSELIERLQEQQRSAFAPDGPSVPVASPVPGPVYGPGMGFGSYSRPGQVVFGARDPDSEQDLVPLDKTPKFSEDELETEIRYISRLLSYAAVGIPLSVISCQTNLVSTLGSEVVTAIQIGIKAGIDIGLVMTPGIFQAGRLGATAVCQSVLSGSYTIISYLLSVLYSGSTLLLTNLSSLTVIIFLCYKLLPGSLNTIIEEVTEHITGVRGGCLKCLGDRNDELKSFVKALQDLKTGSQNKIRQILENIMQLRNSQLQPIEDQIYNYLIESENKEGIVNNFRKLGLIVKKYQSRRDELQMDDLSDAFTQMGVHEKQDGGKKSRRHHKKGKAHKTRKHHKKAHKVHKAHKKAKHATRKGRKAHKAHKTRSSPKRVARRGRR